MDDYDAYVTGRLQTLRRSAYLLCGDWDRGDDLVQRVLTQLFVHWKRARKADNLDAYVHTMLVRRFIDEQRSSWVRRVRLFGAGTQPEPAAAAAIDPSTRLDLHAALGRLPARQRAVVVLRFLQDLSVEQTADALGCSAGTVKSQTSRALDALRRLLDVKQPIKAWSKS